MEDLRVEKIGTVIHREFDWRERRTQPVGEKSRTKQSMKDETDINLIMERFTRTGHISHLNHATPTFGDFTGATDYQQAVNQVLDTQRQFEALPSAIRDHLSNDPAQLLDLVMNPERRKEAEELGLLEEGEPSLADQVAAGVAAGMTKKEEDEPTPEEGA